MRSGLRGGIVRMRGLWRHPKTGKPYYRRRAGGKTTLVPLPDDLAEDHPDFIAAWAAAARTGAPVEKPKAGSVASTWAAALASAEAHVWSRGYRAIIERQARAICAKAGHVVAAAVREKHVRADVTAAPNPAARLKAWRCWADVCLRRSWIEADPARAVTVRTARTEGHPPWTDADVAKFRARWPIGTVPRAAMELLHWTGCRVSDAVKIGPQMVRGGVLTFRQTKTKEEAHVPWTCPVPAFADPADRELMHQALAPLAGHLTFLATAQGRTRSAKALSTLMQDACRAAEIDVSAHGLRKTRAINLAEARAVPHEIGAWTGHHSLAEITKYTAKMNRRAAVIGTPPEPPGETLPDPVETRRA